MSPYKDPEQRRAWARNRFANDATHRMKAKQQMLDYARRKIVDYKFRIAEIKAATPCADCQKSFDPVCMDFDHLGESEKGGNISTMVSKGVSWKALLAEMAKCEIVCSNCHRLRSKVRDVRIKPLGERAIPAVVARNWALVTAAKSVPCADCRKTFDPVCMDFDHLGDFEKLHNISRLASRHCSAAAIESEIAKCEVVCCNCHRLRTKDRRPPTLVPNPAGAINGRRKKSGGSSKFKGVSKDGARWAAYIYFDGTRRRLGRYATEEEAARAYDAAEREEFGPEGLFNLPGPGEQSCIDS